MTKIIPLLLLVITFAACSKSGISDRDLEREKLKNNAEIKRKELSLVAGNYHGSLSLVDKAKSSQCVGMQLDIKDIPTVVDGQVDPVMTPTLGGFLRFQFGSDSKLVEYLPFSVEKADYDPKRQRIDLVLNNNEFKALKITLEQKGNELDGTYSAPEVSASGSLKLIRTPAGSLGCADKPLRGTFRGVVKNTDLATKFVEINLITSQDTDQAGGIKITGGMKLYFNNFTDPDFDPTTYIPANFTEVKVRYFTRDFIAKASGTYNFTINGTATGDVIQGDLFSDTTGKLGEIEVKKQ